MTEEKPNVAAIRIEYEDGSELAATGDEARKWSERIDAGLSLLAERAGEDEKPPKIDFDEVPDWR